jgi:hypothetical protein
LGRILSDGLLLSVAALTFAGSTSNLADMEESLGSKLVPGTQVKVTQQIAARDRTWTSDIRGTVVSYNQKQTGSWFAHSRGDRLWLDRLTLRLPDGEITSLILDEFSHIEIISAAPAALNN